MTRKERLLNELEELKSKRRQFIKRGDLVKAMGFDEAIKTKETEIKDCELYEYQPLSNLVNRDQLAKNKVYGRLLEIAIAADYLADTAVECKYILQQLGVGDIKMVEDVEIIRKYANKLSAMPCNPEYGELYDLMMDDDELVEKLHKTTRAYMKKKLKAKEYKV